MAHLLLQQGHAVTGIDNLSDYYNPLLKRKRLEFLQTHPLFAFHWCDIEDPASLAVVIGDHAGWNAVVHLAARAGVRPSVQHPASYMQTNVLGTLNILDFCRDLHIPKLVSASSSSVYGAANAIPFREEADITQPLSPYAASKVAGEAICHSYHHLYKLDVSVLRLFTVYGPAGRPDMSMFRFVRAIVEGRPITVYGDGTQRRDFSYVDDIANGIISALRPGGFRVYNLGADHPVTLCDVIHLIESISERRAVIEYQPGDPSDVPATWADVARARQELGWTAKVPLETGIRNTIQWYLQNRDWAAVI